MPRDNLSFILVRPRNPGNIGSAARVMANFGFSDLRVVSPHPPIWDEALKLAADSKSLVRKAKVFATLREALDDRSRVYGTTALTGRVRKSEIRSLPKFRPVCASAVVFGPENNGLSESDLQFCDELLNIPTNTDRPSLNLAQSVAIVCYELGARRKTAQTYKTSRELLPSRGIERLVSEIEAALLKLRYRPSMSPSARREKVRRLLRRRGVAKTEGGFLSEVLRRVSEAPL